ncbi:hypothetical protein AcW1_006084 [Taiwanofungus camphoratus]|nr:hypothetical protein AcW2_004846 [Antrodia cinnamomea]KAI0934623.1 hypothetical protein AcV5_006405 [Antrodia cinnamomea]KAI0950095.1 hypothetical protein AcV7_008663 [Antrodia cinnamomea]KAI0957811.1 hypothetical protein AcW1_006084 [Antrodia cinnamomea]
MHIKPPTAKSPSSFPDFDPHVTLASVPLSASVTELQAAIPPDQATIPIRFKSVDVGQKYFMSVYVAVHHTPELVAMRERLGMALGDRAVPNVPHMSLQYIADSEPEERSRVVEGLRSAGTVVNTDAGVALICPGNNTVEEMAEKADVDRLEGFDGEEIWIVKCEGPVPDWEVLQKITLTKSA